jgi:hypothetical protein
MRFLRPLAVAFVAVCALALPAQAKLLIEIDKSAQRMTVSQDGAQLYVWPVSTGQRGYDTPSGAYKPFRMEKDHFSREWDDAPMPNSIFFTTRGHAIHGTTHQSAIGRPASHGCVRLELQNARVLFGLVRQAGMANTQVVLFGATGPGSSAPAMVRRAPQYDPRGYSDDDITGSAPRRAEREPFYQQNPWGGRDPYERTTRVPPPPFYGPGRPFGY